jgi:hypothetical protein
MQDHGFSTGTDPDAVHCKACGLLLNIPQRRGLRPSAEGPIVPERSGTML